jgi:PAS domain S-box-containing protein
MRQRKPIARQTKHISGGNARIAALFTAKACVILLLLAGAALVSPLWRGWKSYQHIRAQEAQLSRLGDLLEQGKYRDEVRTMSAQMAAATGDSKWVVRYDESAPRVRPTVDELCQVAQDDTIREEEILVSFADDKLTEVENKAIELIRRGTSADAVAILQSREYEDQKDAYNRAVKTLTTNARKILQEQQAEHTKKILVALASLGIILPSTVTIWLVVLVAAGRIARHLEHRQKTSAFAREWQETFNAITDGVCIIDGKDGNIVQCNKAMTRFLDRPYDEVIGHSCYELLYGSSEPVKACPLQRMFETCRSETMSYQMGDRWFKIKVDPLIDHSGKLVGAVHILSDVTEYKKATIAMEDSENKFRLAFENAQDAILWIEGETGIITNCNQSAEELLGEERIGIVGRHHVDLYPTEKIEHFSKILSQYNSEPNSNVEAEIIKPGGEIRTVTIAVSMMLVGEKKIIQAILRDVTQRKIAMDQIKSLAKFPSEDPNPVLRVSTDCKILYANSASSSVLAAWKIQGDHRLSEPWDSRVAGAYSSKNSATYELDCEDGRTYFMTLQPVAGSEYVNVYGLNITDLKKAERARIALELQLGQKQKMEAVGTLAGGIAHDFNNILAAMQGYAELSLDDLSEDNPVKDNLEQIMSCVSRATKLVKQILTFSRKDQQEQEKQPVQISSIVKEVLGMLRSSLPATIKICRKIQAEYGTVMADPTQIHQVLVNLCTNASHAMRDNGGLLEVSLVDVSVEAETNVGAEHLSPGTYMKLTVKDTGCGMDNEVMQHIFDPFFTTKNVDEGTGLGLSVVHGIIKSHDGAITVSSQQGEGTTFDILLPKMDRDQAEDSHPHEADVDKRTVILVVDDEEMMVDVTRKTLEKLGHVVVAKTNSIDALELFQENPEKFDLIITDQVMPNMMGVELARNLTSIRPGIPIILCSGFPEKVCVEELKSAGIKEFITKPVTRQQISETVQKILDENKVSNQG